MLFVSPCAVDVMNAIMPVVFMELSEFIVYWVEPCEVADRAAIPTTLFLAAAFKTYMSTLLPTRCRTSRASLA